MAMWLHPVSPPRSSNRTCRFPASGFPAGFTSTLSAVGLTILGQAMDAQLPEDRSMAEANSASRLHFVPPCEKAPHVLYDMPVERAMRLPAGSVAEVAVPAAQDRVQPIPGVRPGPAVGGFKMIAHALLEPGHALWRRARPQIQFAIAPMPVRAEAIAKELEPFPPCVFELGLDLIQGQPKPGYRIARPVQRLGRSPAA